MDGIDYSAIAQGTNSVATAMLWILITVAIATTIILIFWWFSHNVIFIIRKVTGDRPLTLIDKARVIRKKGKPTRWKLRKLKTFVPVPPKEAIDVTTKGKLFVEAYLTEDGEFHYITDKLEGQIGSIYPVKSVDKEFYAQQVEEGNKYNQKTISELIQTLAPYLTVVLILVLFMIFFNETVAPSIEFGNKLSGVADTLTRAIEALNTCSQSVTIAPN